MCLPEIDTLWDYADPARSERRFRDVLPVAEQASEDAYTAELLTQIARAVCLQRRYAEADAWAERAHELIPTLAPTVVRPRIRYLLEKGRILNDLGRTPEALKLFLHAWEQAEHTPHRVLAADALHMLGYVMEGAESLRWHRRAIEFCERSEGERFRRWLCTLHSNVAGKYEALQDYELAVSHVQQCLAVAADLDWSERALGAQCFLARLQRLQGSVSAALASLEELLNEESPSGYVFEEVGECLLRCGREEEAPPFFRRAFELLSRDPWFPPSEQDRLKRIERLSGPSPA